MIMIARCDVMTRLQKERQKRALTQMLLGSLANLTPGEISKIERRRVMPSALHLARLGRALGLDPEALLDDVDEGEVRRG
jgi:transcriptional regulator with XRE-family HTH domain